MKKFLNFMAVFAAIAVMFTAVSCKDDDDASNPADQGIKVSLYADYEEEVYVGGTMQITASITPATVSQEVTYESDDEYIATVDENGLVTGVSEGEVEIKIASKAYPFLKSFITIKVLSSGPSDITSIENLAGLWMNTAENQRVLTGYLIEVEANATSAKMYEVEEVKGYEGLYYNTGDEYSLEMTFDENSKTYTVKQSNIQVESGTFAVDKTTIPISMTLTPTNETARTYKWSPREDYKSYTDSTMNDVFGFMTLKLTFDAALNAKKVSFKVAPSQNYKNDYNGRCDIIEEGEIDGNEFMYKICGYYKDKGETPYVSIIDFTVYSDDNATTKITEIAPNASYFYLPFLDGESVQRVYNAPGTMELTLNFEGFELASGDSVVVNYGADSGTYVDATATIQSDGKSAKATLEEKYANSDGWFNGITVKVTKSGSEIKPTLSRAWFEFNKDDGFVLTLTYADPSSYVRLTEKTVKVPTNWGKIVSYESTDLASIVGASAVKIVITGANEKVCAFAGNSDANPNPDWVADLEESNSYTATVTNVESLKKLAKNGLYLNAAGGGDYTVTVSYIAGNDWDLTEDTGNYINLAPVTFSETDKNAYVNCTAIKDVTVNIAEIKVDVTNVTGFTWMCYGSCYVDESNKGGWIGNLTGGSNSSFTATITDSAVITKIKTDGLIVYGGADDDSKGSGTVTVSYVAAQ